MFSDHLPSSSSSSSSSLDFQEHFMDSFVSRKLLQQLPFDHTTAQQAHDPDKNNLSGNVLLLLSVLLCGIICSLGLHYIIRCAFTRSRSFMISDPISSPSSTPRGSEVTNKGIKKKALKMFPVVNYSPEMNLSGLGEECVICLSDFASGEQLRLLPKCNHGFHVRCIDKWLKQHMTCPKCRHCLVETCQKILGDCDEAEQVAAATTSESIEIRIAPLEPEARVATFRESS
ncbi:PREDICTED: RING-H2 finger protein ATL77-like [Camelina sativa]|uniref:RING-type E3 ubiquitin transferase n=1 Tax=Camelina sativa TaxID=90675 RepID=A0ABM0W5K3_CAMSA|nr:PREDICTED: RING-H2 finger protein ATL77-like [Camelina sativa]